MILADRILQLRQSRGWSQEELAEKLHVSRQSISKWETGASVPEIGKILEIARLFGITTDSLLVEEAEAESSFQDSEFAETIKVPLNKITLVEAEQFLTHSAVCAKRIAIGVMLCILSPVTLILLAGLALESSGLTENGAAGIGLIVLFLLVAAAVALFITTGFRMKPFETLKKGNFLLEDDASAMVQTGKAAFTPRFNRSITIGVILCILSALPLIAAGVMHPQPELLYVALTCLLLVLVSIAVLLFVHSGIIYESYDRLLKEGCCNPEEAEKEKRSERFGGIYWPIVTAVYLGWSFLSGDWHISWVIWPVAGLLFAGITAAIKSGK